MDRYLGIWGPDIERFWRLAGIPDCIPFEEVNHVFWGFYSRIPHFDCFEGTEEMVFQLSCSGLVLSLVTASSEGDVGVFLDKKAGKSMVMYDLFSIVTSNSQRGRVATVLSTIERLGASPENVAYVEDSPEALEEARKMGFLTIGMLKGHASAARIREANPDPEDKRQQPRNINSPTELVEILRAYM